jgi:hypothetical protein
LWSHFEVIGIFDSEQDCDHAALARNAFDVMMRRGLSPERMGDTWIVNDEDARAVCDLNSELMRWPDPFTAVVEANQWLAKLENSK